MRVATISRILGAAMLVVAAACGSNGTPTNPSGASTQITGLAPAQVIQSAGPQTITVSGLNFVAGLTATLTDPAGSARAFSGGEIQALQNNSFQITAVFSTPGTYTLQVKNISGAPSDPFSFPVQSQASGTTPQITSISPASTLHNSNAQFLTITGAQFSPSLTVTLIDPTGQPSQLVGAIVGIVTPNQFQVIVTLSRVGTYTLFVTNPTGEISNSVAIPVL